MELLAAKLTLAFYYVLNTTIRWAFRGWAIFGFYSGGVVVVDEVVVVVVVVGVVGSSGDFCGTSVN